MRSGVSKYVVTSCRVCGVEAPGGLKAGWRSIPGLPTVVGSTHPALQHIDLARELMEIDVVTKDDVPIGITNQEVVTEHFSLTGTARRGYAHVRAPLSKQSVHPEAQCEAAVTFATDFRHEQGNRRSLRGPVAAQRESPFVTSYKRSTRSLAKGSNAGLESRIGHSERFRAHRNLFAPTLTPAQPPEASRLSTERPTRAMGQRDAEIESAMADSEQEIDQLRRRLDWEAGGPLAEISNQVTGRLLSIVSAIAGWLRQSGEERPLISVLLAFEAGFALGRWGGRRA
jgi:hypothetical protein